MTVAQRKFAEGLAQDLTAGEAYARAFPKSRNPGQDAARLLSDKNPRKPEILAEVQRIREKVEKMPGSVFLTIQEKRNFLAAVVRSKPNEAGPDNPLCEVRMSKAGPYYCFPDKGRMIALDNDLASEGSMAAGQGALAGLLGKLTGAKK